KTEARKHWYLQTVRGCNQKQRPRENLSGVFATSSSAFVTTTSSRSSAISASAWLPSTPTGLIVLRSAEQLAALQEACFRRTAEKLQPGYREQLSPQDVQATRRHISENLAELLAESGLFLSQVEQELLVARVLDDILYSGPITGLLRDPDVSEIFINGPDKVYVNEGGRRRPTDVRFR